MYTASVVAAMAGCSEKEPRCLCGKVEGLGCQRARGAQDQFADLEESYNDHCAKVWREVAKGVGGEHAPAS